MTAATAAARMDEHLELEPLAEDDAEVISPAELAQSRKSMNLTELKAKPIHELVKLAESMGLESLARSRKQDIIFSILKAHARNGEDIYGDGVLEILQDGFGFLRSADGSYLAGPDDIYVSPEPDPALQPAHRRYRLRPDPSPEGRRALFRAAQGRRDQFRLARELAQQGAVREPDAVSPDQAAEARARQRQHRRPDRAHHRPGRADRQGPARTDRLAAEGRQDDAAAEHRDLDHLEPSGGAPDRAAHRRAARGSHRDAAHREGRGRLVAPSTSRPPATCRWPRWSSRRPSAWSSTRRTS